MPPRAATWPLRGGTQPPVVVRAGFASRRPGIIRRGRSGTPRRLRPNGQSPGCRPMPSKRAVREPPLRNHKTAHGLTGNARLPPRPRFRIPAKAGIQGFDCLPFKTGGSRIVGRPRGGAAPAKPSHPRGRGRIYAPRCGVPRFTRRRFNPVGVVRERPAAPTKRTVAGLSAITSKNGRFTNRPYETVAAPARSPRAFARICGYGAFP